MNSLPVGTDNNLINTPEATEAVTKVLSGDILSILDFSDQWQEWIITHLEHLKVENLPQNSLISFYPEGHNSGKADYLHWAFLSYIDAHPNLTHSELLQIWHLLICIFTAQIRVNAFPVVPYLRKRKPTVKALKTLRTFTNYLKKMIPDYYLRLLLSKI